MQEHNPVVLMNFSGIYREEEFWKNRQVSWIELQDVCGTNCYCDEEGREKLHRRLAPYPSKAIHFLDSGDFHYLTEYWVSRLQEPFSLIVFDHHPDMQQPQWEGLVSCGGWVTDVLKSNPFVRHIILVGVSDELMSQIPAALRSKVLFYSESEIDHHQA